MEGRAKKKARRSAGKTAKVAARPRSAPRSRVERRRAQHESPNPIERYIACFVTAREAASAAGVSAAMLRRMRVRGYVSTRARALLMAQACEFRVEAVELMALPKGDG
ncbi:hypothetical protein [Lysobacter sp. CA196]|uniref:hypothetical protein n=1 Tax=Lysobacter sp. CA196 TaxID=3455606 RepID=UPI003F8CF993